MAIKNFTSEILTSADTNTFLANSGLVYITQQAMTTTTTSINNCFTSAYRNYRIVIATNQISSNASFNFRLRVGGTDSSAASYKFGQQYVTTVGGSGVDNANAGTEVRVGYVASANGDTETVLDICDPQTATRTKGNYQFFGYDGGAWAQRQAGWMFDATTQFDGISFFTSAGAVTSGTIYVYGYRNA